MTLLNDPRRRHRHLGVAAAAAGLLAALLTAGPAVATPDPGDGPTVPEKISKSVQTQVRKPWPRVRYPGWTR